jgi:hypothetical protein
VVRVVTVLDIELAGGGHFRRQNTTATPYDQQAPIAEGIGGTPFARICAELLTSVEAFEESVLSIVEG